MYLEGNSVKQFNSNSNHQMELFGMAPMPIFLSMCYVLFSSLWLHDLERFSAIFPFVRKPPATCGFPSQRANYEELWWFICCQPKQTVEPTVELPVTWDIMVLMWPQCSLWVEINGWAYQSSIGWFFHKQNSNLAKHLLHYLNHIHISQVLLQQIWGDTCQM